MHIGRDKKKLHRVRSHVFSDWHDVKPAKRNVWQRVAASTYGLVTIGNAVTIVGFLLTLYGLLELRQENTLIGIVLIVVGRWGDYFDGILADMTKTKSLIGATLDETADMIILALALIILVNVNVVPLAVAVAIAVPKSLNVLAWIVAKTKRLRSHPTSQSKLGTAVLWSGLSLYILHTVLDDLTRLRVDWFAGAVVAVGLALTVPSTVLYLRKSIFAN